ncbi:MAG: DUF4040 domain-containing protein [Bacilli bacterium]|nr:DUF4040 domain-containing protein [Bacilli bacterium]
MNATDIIIMILLTSIVVCALATIFTKRLLTAVVIYMSFSLIMSIIWVLLQAPDLAITEAAVGAGITSILYFVTLDKIKRIEETINQNVTL